MNDIYDISVPKYSYAQDIYDALSELVDTEEMNILSEIGANVSYDGQGYYYTDKGYELKTKFEALSDYGNKIWIFDLAIAQIDGIEIHDIIFSSLGNSDMAKRIGFKKLFVEHLLNGKSQKYNEVSEDFFSELTEFDRFDNHSMSGAWKKTAEEHDLSCGDFSHFFYQYTKFAHCLSEKVNGLKLPEETKTVIESRALLTSYDDFIHGLRVNQELHRHQEFMYSKKVAELESDYREKVKKLLIIAKEKGILAELIGEIEDVKLLNGVKK